MDQKVRDFVTEKVKEMVGADSCSMEARAAGQAWLDHVGTDGEAEETRRLAAELEMDIMPVEGLIAFAESDAGVQLFGPETAGNVAAHGRKLQASGAKYCDCPACAAAEAILEKKGELL